MTNRTTFRLVGMDEDDNALFYCSYCGNIIPVELDEHSAISLSRVDDTCPECNAVICGFEWE